MVQGYQSGSWGFPKGKIGKDETPLDCAIRETLEETGFDCRPLVVADAEVEYIQWNKPDSQVRLYVIRGVREEEARFLPQTRREIRKIAWVPIADIGAKASSRYFNVVFFARY